MIFQNELTAIDQELQAYERLLSARRAQRAMYTELQGKCNGYLLGLGELVKQVQGVGEDAIATLRTEIEKLFGSDDGTDDGGGHEPTNPTPDTDPRSEPNEDTRFTPGSIISDTNGSVGIVIGGNNIGMRVDWLGLGEVPNPPTGKGIWYNWQKDEQALASLKPATHDQVKLLTTEEFLQFQCWEEEQLDEHWDNEWFDVGIGCQCKWGGATINRWIVVLADSCEWASPLATPIACLLWEDSLLTGQHCFVSFKQNENKGTNEGETTVPYVELVKVSDTIAYQRKHDGEIVCCYFGFRTKAIAQSWLHFFEAITSKVGLRQAKRLEDCKWEIKAQGVSIKQIERFQAECDFSKSYRSEIGSAKPPHVEVTLPSDKIQEGQRIRTLCGKELMVTTSLQHSDQTFFAREGNGQRRLLRLDDVAEFLEGTDESPAQAAGIEPPSGWGKVQQPEELKFPPCPFSEGDLVDWKGCKLRVVKIGVEKLYCILKSDPEGTKHHTTVPLAECSLVESVEPESLGEGDTCEVLEGRYKGQVGTVASFNRYFEYPVSLNLPGGHVKKFLLNEVKLVSKSKTSQSRQDLQTGSVLLGNRVVTTGTYAGLGRRNAINNARNGLEDKLAAMELVKAGVSPEEAMAAVTGSTTASEEYDF